MSKAERRRRARLDQVVALLGRRPRTQAQLIALLAARGMVVTQATVSRDLRDVGAVKARVGGYQLPAPLPAAAAAGSVERRLLAAIARALRAEGERLGSRGPP